MGEYVTVTIYKPLNELPFMLSKFEQLCWDLYKAKGNQEKIEELYRAINFVTGDGRIFDLNMRFLEKDGVIYQTNSGVYGSEQLPNLSLSYKFHLPDFWLSVLKPEELTMDEHDTIKCLLEGRAIHGRFTDLLRANNHETFKSSSIWAEYKNAHDGHPPIQSLIKQDDLVEIHIGQIYYAENEDYRSAARKSITKQRKDIALQINVPHWTKKTPY